MQMGKKYDVIDNNFINISKLFSYPPSQRRCSVHSNNLTKSMNELRAERLHVPHMEEVRKSTKQTHFPITRTVSTSTEIFDGNEGIGR